jgi:benzoyl-CoA reductase/2-hydroxyglutaryl-CoA dehydratase subunit BcrC/BadD/HgdB
MAYISDSKIILTKIPKKEISFLGKTFQKRQFDGLCKQLENAFGKNYQKRKFPKKEIICQKNRKNARKILKNTEKIPTGLESAQNGQLIPKISKKWFFWLDKSGKIPKKLPKIPEYV